MPKDEWRPLKQKQLAAKSIKRPRGKYKPATYAQLNYLKNLGYTGEQNIGRITASTLIHEYKQRQQ